MEKHLKRLQVSRQNLAPFLNAWLSAPDTILLQRHFMNGHILQAVDSYNPEKDAVFLIEYEIGSIPNV